MIKVAKVAVNVTPLVEVRRTQKENVLDIDLRIPDVRTKANSKKSMSNVGCSGVSQGCCGFC